MAPRTSPRCGATSPSCAPLAERERGRVGAARSELLVGARLVEVPLLPATCTTSTGSGSDRCGIVRRRRPLTSPAVHILLATDADWIVDDITAALGWTRHLVHGVPRGPRRRRGRGGRTRRPTSPIFDLQIGSMGGMAVTMSLRLDESAGVLPHVPVLMLLDRSADVHLARRCGADGWLSSPSTRCASGGPPTRSPAGGRYTEGLAADAPAVDPMVDLGSDGDSDDATTSEAEPVTAG